MRTIKMRLTTNMKWFKIWMSKHPKKRVDGYFSLNGRDMTHDEIVKIVDYAVIMGYETEADIPSDELVKVLGIKE